MKKQEIEGCRKRLFFLNGLSLVKVILKYLFIIYQKEQNMKLLWNEMFYETCFNSLKTPYAFKRIKNIRIIFLGLLIEYWKKTAKLKFQRRNKTFKLVKNFFVVVSIWKLKAVDETPSTTLYHPFRTHSSLKHLFFDPPYPSKKNR